MHLIYTSDWMFRRGLRNLKRLFDEGLISEELYEQHRRRAMDWRADRLYGKASTPVPQPRTPKTGAKKRTKPAITSQPAEEPPVAIPQPEGQPEAT